MTECLLTRAEGTKRKEAVVRGRLDVEDGTVLSQSLLGRVLPRSVACLLLAVHRMFCGQPGNCQDSFHEVPEHPQRETI